MIDIKELRIGNLIDKNGIASRIEVINNEIDEVYFVADDFYNRDFCCNIKPIPLTEKRLFELEKINELLYVDKSGFVIFKNGYAYQFIFNDYPFLHQLQNLYFALTNQELTIK